MWHVSSAGIRVGKSGFQHLKFTYTIHIQCHYLMIDQLWHLWFCSFFFSSFFFSSSFFFLSFSFFPFFVKISLQCVCPPYKRTEEISNKINSYQSLLFIIVHVYKNEDFPFTHWLFNIFSSLSLLSLLSPSFSLSISLSLSFFSKRLSVLKDWIQSAHRFLLYTVPEMK